MIFLLNISETACILLASHICWYKGGLYMTNDEQNALRLLLREEVNAAIYASEQRMGDR
jgi:hypothetical protein